MLSQASLAGPINLPVPPLATPRLNYDLLMEIMLFLDSRTAVSRLMKTCRRLHARGATLLPRFPTRIDSHNHVSFCRFMLADLSRCAYLHDITVALEEIDRKHSWAAEAIPDIVRHAHSLKKVRIDTDVLLLLPAVGPALASLTSIRTFWSQGDARKLQALLQTMRSPIMNVCLCFTMLIQRDAVPRFASRTWLASNFVSKLSSLRESLTTVVLNKAYWPSSSDMVFPNLHSLTIRKYCATDLPALCRLAPNLRNLWLGESDDIPSSADGLRLENMNDQRTGGSWYSLDFVDITLDALYALAPQCHIRHLNLTDLSSSAETSFTMYREVMAVAKPDSICLFLTEKSPAALTEIIRSTPPSLTTLEVTLEVLQSNDDTDNIDHLVQSFAFMTSLTRLCLKVHSESPAEADNTHRGPPAVLKARPPSRLENPKDELFARRLAHVLPSLQYIHLVLHYLRPDGFRAGEASWQVKGGEVVPVPLSWKDIHSSSYIGVLPSFGGVLLGCQTCSHKKFRAAAFF